MNSAAQFRGYATDCVRVAQQISDPADKATLLQMAKLWLNLAEIAEKDILLSSDDEKNRTG